MTFIPSPPPPAAISFIRSNSDSVSSTVPFNRSRALMLRESTRSCDRIGEIAGSTAAECAAICCCFPCGIVGLVMCAVVKLPAGLCKRAYIRRRRRRMSARRRKTMGMSLDEDELEGWRIKEEWGIPSPSPSPEVLAMEKEMWTRFYETGFWRSPSQRELW